MTYIQTINRQISSVIEGSEQLVCFGQNIAAGSHISGLTLNLPRSHGVEIVNMPNCENAQLAFGFGMALTGVNSVFFIKQLDFLLLTCDQIVNTNNMLRLSGATGSFTVVAVVVDSGFEGPQSRFNALSDLCSMADIEGYNLSEPHGSEVILEQHLVRPGFRIMAVSQRLFRSELQSLGQSAVQSTNNGEITKHASGSDATLICFNFAFPQICDVYSRFTEAGRSADVYVISAAHPIDWSELVRSVSRTGKAVILDDSRSRNPVSNHLYTALLESGISPSNVFRHIRHSTGTRHLSVNEDKFEVDSDAIVAELCSKDV